MTVNHLSAEQLRDKMNKGESLFILDVRNEGDYSDWKIEGKTIESLNIPYFEFLDDEDVADGRLPKDKEIVTVCAKGGSSRFVAEILDGKGFRATSLDGGMKAWSLVYNTVPVDEENQLKLYQINRMAKGCLSYMIFSRGEAAVVDPGRHIDFYMELAAREGPKSPTSWIPISMRTIFPVDRPWLKKRGVPTISPPVIFRHASLCVQTAGGEQTHPFR